MIQALKEMRTQMHRLWDENPLTRQKTRYALCTLVARVSLATAALLASFTALDFLPKPLNHLFVFLNFIFLNAASEPTANLALMGFTLFMAKNWLKFGFQAWKAQSIGLSILSGLLTLATMGIAWRFKENYRLKKGVTDEQKVDFVPQIAHFLCHKWQKIETAWQRC